MLELFKPKRDKSQDCILYIVLPFCCSYIAVGLHWWR